MIERQSGQVRTNHGDLECGRGRFDGTVGGRQVFSFGKRPREIGETALPAFLAEKGDTGRPAVGLRAGRDHKPA